MATETMAKTLTSPVSAAAPYDQADGAGTPAEAHPQTHSWAAADEVSRTLIRGTAKETAQRRKTMKI